MCFEGGVGFETGVTASYPSGRVYCENFTHAAFLGYHRNTVSRHGLVIFAQGLNLLPVIHFISHVLAARFCSRARLTMSLRKRSTAFAKASISASQCRDQKQLAECRSNQFVLSSGSSGPPCWASISSSRPGFIAISTMHFLSQFGFRMRSTALAYAFRTVSP